MHNVFTCGGLQGIMSCMMNMKGSRQYLHSAARTGR